MKRLTPEKLSEAVQELCTRDARLATVVERYGPPPPWLREPGFGTLVQIILEQQVSLASARAAFERLNQAIPLTPTAFLGLDDRQLRGIGFSRQKARYVRLLALALLDGFDLEGLERLDDALAHARLTALTGVGRWTADIYLLMALGRPDIWPVGDLALRVAVQRLLGHSQCPTEGGMEELGHSWRPLRSVAARLFWHFYLRAAGDRIAP